MTDSRPATCAARMGADQQMRCARCGLVWDIDDPEPPECQKHHAPTPIEGGGPFTINDAIDALDRLEALYNLDESYNILALRGFLEGLNERIAELVEERDALRAELTALRKQEPNEASTEAIKYALKNHCDGGMEFLRCWFYGDFQSIRNEWPDAPESVFIGADPLHPETTLDSAPTAPMSALEAVRDACAAVCDDASSVEDIAQRCAKAIRALDLSRFAQPVPAVPDGWRLVAIQETWSPGMSVFKQWCTEYFGPDSDESYLAKAVLNLPSAIAMLAAAKEAK